MARGCRRIAIICDGGGLLLIDGEGQEGLHCCLARAMSCFDDVCFRLTRRGSRLLSRDLFSGLLLHAWRGDYARNLLACAAGQSLWQGGAFAWYQRKIAGPTIDWTGR